MQKLKLLFLIFATAMCANIAVACNKTSEIKVGAEKMDTYLPMLKDKNMALVVNQSSLVQGTLLVDTLLTLDIKIKSILCPEHGFRGTADAGEVVNNEIDSKTGLPIISLYGSNKKPKKEQLEGIDVVVFDLQDVGVRFYTYISTMHYVMEACAENDIQFIVLDRPNPNGHYVDGPVLEEKFKSFVGMHPIPVVHGLTVGELAQMINVEGWLTNGVKCDLSVVKMDNWTHDTPYDLPVKPSPNLPNARSINLYPSLCFFEPTQISIGRGTQMPFQVIGSPLSDGDFAFTPISIDGMSKYPKHENKQCHGLDLRISESLNCINLEYLIKYYQDYPEKETFFTSSKFFNLLAGNGSLQEQIKSGATESEIRESWKAKLDKYKILRTKYLIYK